MTRIALRAREWKAWVLAPCSAGHPNHLLRAHSRHSRFPFLFLLLVSALSAQAPLLQDGAASLRQARLDWTLGQEPLGPSTLPFFEIGFGAAGSEGVSTPLSGSEGLGQGTQGWGLGLQGRYGKGGWSFAATALALRDHGRTQGVLQRAALAYQTESGWRAALEAAPFAWGSGLNGGDLLGDSARPFPRLSLATPEAQSALGRWQMTAFTGALEDNRPIPAGLYDREARLRAQAAGLDLQKPRLWGALVQASLGTRLEATLGTLRMEGGRDALGQPAPSSALRTATLLELRLRLPALAQLAQARGASIYLSRSAAPEDDALSLAPPRHLGGLQLVWEGWDLALEYATAAAPGTASAFQSPTYLAGFSTRGDLLGAAFGREAVTRTLELGLPLFLEGQGHFKFLRATTPRGVPSGAGTWFFQGDAQWRTATGKVGASLASSREDGPGSPRWGWSFTFFQAFRVF